MDTKGGAVTLTPSKQGNEITPYPSAIERVGQLVLISGIAHNEVIYECQIVEITPLLISTMIKVAIDEKQISYSLFEKTISEARNIVIGDINQVIPGESITTSLKKPKLVIDIGHRSKAPGACSAKFNICEFQLNSEIAQLMKVRIRSADVIITSRDLNS